MDQHIARIGELVLGRPGVMLMTDLWSIAVGLALLPLRGAKGWRYAWPGPVVALLLVVIWPGLWGVFLVSLLATGIVMAAVMWLIVPDRRSTLLRGAALIITATVLLVISPSLPQWASFPLIPVVMFGVPAGFILLTEAAVRRRVWVGPLLSSLFFMGAWLVWMARDHFYRLKA